jgi:hypothetical protein
MVAIVTVVETVTFVARAKGGMTDEERHRAIDMIAADPECGVLIPGGGGLRKVRFGIGGRGKRGGVRIVYYYQGLSVPVFLLTVFAKNERDDLSRRELNQLAGAAKQLARTYGG